MFGGKALEWMAGTLIWMPGAPGVRQAIVPSLPLALLLYPKPFSHSAHLPSAPKLPCIQLDSAYFNPPQPDNCPTGHLFYLHPFLPPAMPVCTFLIAAPLPG